MLTVHLRVNDAATGKPTPVRLRISGPAGEPYPPLGRFAEFPVGRNDGVGGHLRFDREAWWYIDGSCEVALPAGVPLRIRATKGPEYRPLDESVTLGPGKMALRFAIERWIDPRAKGWHAGDSRCHFLAPHDALLEAAAEDLDVVNLLAGVHPTSSLDGTTYLAAANLTAFSGQAPALEADGRIVAVNTLNTHPVLGKVGLLYSHRPVFPLAFGGDEPDDWSICDWCDQCHRKGGLTVWVDPFREAGGLVGGEALIAAILGKIDAIEVTAQPQSQLLPWVYRLWNAGFLIPLVGGSGKDSNTIPLGAMRTYALRRNGESFSYKEWIESVRAGRTIVTSGPFVAINVEEDRTIAEFHSAVPVERTELVSDAGVIADTTSSADGIEYRHQGQQNRWVAARCFGANGTILAHTSPSAIRGEGHPRSREAIAHLVRLVEATREWIESVGRFTQPKRKAALLDRCAEARGRLKAETVSG